MVRRSIHLPELPERLDGLKITHLSDLHIGRLTTPDHLPHIVDACQRAKGDLIAVTGDFVDFSNNVLDDVINAMRRLEAPLGVYMVVGNHDYLDNGHDLIHRFKDAGLKLLLNQHDAIEHRGCRINISGIDYAHHPRKLAHLVHRTLRGSTQRKASDLSLLLAHHPDAFDTACRHHVDLTLSGHTHGGQVVLSNWWSKKGSVGLGSLAFRYPRGLYRRGNNYLYVTSGVGSWFPLRVNCPAEIALLTLKCQEPNGVEPSHP